MTKWDPSSYWELATDWGASRARLSRTDDTARASLPARLRNRLDRLDAPDFRWEGEVICAVAAKRSSPHVTPCREGPQARALPAR